MIYLSGLLVFVMVWWMVFLMVLPYKATPEPEPQPGHDPGAPACPLLKQKIGVTTLIAVLVVASLAPFYHPMERRLYQFIDTYQAPR